MHTSWIWNRARQRDAAFSTIPGLHPRPRWRGPRPTSDRSTRPSLREFTSTRCAWERLPSDVQGKLKDAVATHSYANSRDQIHPDLATEMERRVLPPVRWRLNWRNPSNDRRALYVASHAYAIDGMDDRDARQLLAQLLDEATRREFVYSHKWRQGDAVMWDNRAMLHRGRPWNYVQERTMVRTTTRRLKRPSRQRFRITRSPARLARTVQRRQ